MRYYKFQYTWAFDGISGKRQQYFSSLTVLLGCLQYWNSQDWKYSLQPDDIEFNLKAEIEQEDSLPQWLPLWDGPLPHQHEYRGFKNAIA